MKCSRDVSDRLLIPEKLYGREREIDALLASFDRVVANGTPELVLVSGYSGIGKSSVVNELHKVLVLPRGLFASGKFDQYKRDIPYATLAQAFQSLFRLLLGKSEAELGRWRNALSEALGPNAKLIVNLVPELERLIGKQPPVPELSPQDAQSRFQMVFRRFLGIFARKEHPLALFLDDLQWLDTATLDLLEYLVTHSEVQHLLLVGAYRDNEVGPAHPLMRTHEAIRKAGTRVHEIVLAPLGLDDVARLVSDALHSKPERTRPLAQLALEKTGGNPFFVIQFFTVLAEEGLLAFDPDTADWTWNVARIQAKRYTDNVVDLMAGKLNRLPSSTQEALQQLACLGNVAEIATLTRVHGKSEAAIHAALWDAVRAGLVFRLKDAYTFLHDRVQEAAYALIPESERPAAHLRIGRALALRTAATELEEKIFEIVNQLDRGAALITAPEERVRVAELNLIAGKRAKISTAYASACLYFAAGMALLDERDWGSRYELMFSLWLERATCEFLTGDFDTAEQLIGELLERGSSNIDQAAAYHLKVQLHVVKSEAPQAVTCALACLHLFGIDIPAHPTREQVEAEYEMVWRNLEGRPIEDLLDLPLMTDPELQAAMRLLSVLLEAACFTDFRLYCLLVCRLVNVSARNGTSSASAQAYAWLGTILGPEFRRYSEGYRFGRLACDVVEKHGFIAHRARVQISMGLVAFWTQPIATAIDFKRAGFRTATETGDLSFACYSLSHVIADVLARNDPLDAVWRESESDLDFVRKAGFRDVADIIVSQQRFIAAMQGQTETFATFSDAQFDEAAFEAQLTGDRLSMMICFYWILKQKARFLSGDYAEALAAGEKAKALLWAVTGHIEPLDYFYYAALTVAALYEKAAAEEQQGWRDLLAAHREQLREWAENYPPTFGDKHALVSAEIARLEGRDADAMRLYEQAIESARENRFVQNEGLANELAAQFYLKRGIKKVAHSYLRDARYCYTRWGALGKVKQLDERYPGLAERVSVRPTTAIGTPVEQLDLGTVMKAWQAVYGEIVLEKLVKTLMVIAVEHAGAERGLLILPHGEQHRVEAEITTEADHVEAQLRQTPVTSSELPESLFRYVVRTHEKIVLDDATAQDLFSEDEYIQQRRPRSVLCLPLVKQSKLMGVLYLENNLAPGVFTPKRLAMLELLASQAAISLDHARVYAELAQENSERRKAEEALRASEDRWRKLFENSSTGIALIAPDGRYLATNLALQNMLGYTEEELQGLTAAELMTEDEHAECERLRTETIRGLRRAYRVEKRFRRKDGNLIWTDVSAVLVPATGNQSAFFAIVIVDINERKRAEEELRRSEAFLAQGQRISRTGSWGWQVATGAVYWSEEHFRIFEFDPETDKPSYPLFMERIHPEDRASFEELVNRAVRDQSDFENQYRIVLPDGSIKFLRSVGQAFVNPAGQLEFIGTVMDVTDLKRAEEMQIAMAREREMLVRQRALDLAKANEALRSCLDALASVPELDQFVGQVMAVITGQLGAASGVLALFDGEQKTSHLELLFQDGRVMSPAEADYPESFRSMPVGQEQLFALLNERITVIHLSEPQASIIPDGLHDYFLRQGVRTLLLVPLISQGEVNGFLSFRFIEKRDFQAEELEIARALATQASLAIQLTQLAKTAKRSAVLEERNRLAGEIHDSLAQSFAGISMQLELAQEEMAAKEGGLLGYIRHAHETAKFGLAEARRSVLGLRSGVLRQSGFVTVLQGLVERANLAGRLRCDFRYNRIPEERLSATVQHQLLRIAQEAISNAVRHAKPTVVTVTLRWDSPNLILQVKDNGSGITKASLEKSDGVGLDSMRDRAAQIDAKFEIQTAAGRGTSIIVTVPITS